MAYYQIARIAISLYCHERMTTVGSTKMILIYLILAVFGIANSETEDTTRNPNQPSCFQFSWLGLIDPTTVNCTKITDKPCLTPFVVTDDYTPPNVTWMWNNLDQTSITCSLAPGNACIKYSYTYDNAVVNISYFCGKMIEDKTSALTSGCYNQRIPTVPSVFFNRDEPMTKVGSTKMILIYFILALFEITNSETEDTQRNPNLPSCFQFSWLGVIHPTTVNCTEITDKPCLTPFVVTEDNTPPNVTWMWNNLDQTSITCSLAAGNACMKYSHVYDNAVVNISYFCGKMIEDKTSAMTSGCYNQKVDAHIIEVCACRSGVGTMPCNSSIKANQRISMLIVSIILLVCLWTP